MTFDGRVYDIRSFRVHKERFRTTGFDQCGPQIRRGADLPEQTSPK